MLRPLSFFLYSLSLFALPLNAQTLTQTTPAALQEGQAVSSTSQGFSLTLPKDWKVNESAQDNVFIASSPETGELNENIVVVSFKIIDAKVGLDQFYNQGLKALQQKLENFNLSKSGQGTIAGIPTKWLIYEHSLDNIHAKVIQYLLLTKDRGYVVTFTSSPDNFEKVLPLFQQIANSIQFSNN